MGATPDSARPPLPDLAETTRELTCHMTSRAPGRFAIGVLRAMQVGVKLNLNSLIAVPVLG